MSSSWTPLLDGELVQQARRHVDEIGEDLLQRGIPDGRFSHSVGSGSAGLAVVHAALADATGDGAHTRRAAEHLAHARRVVRTRQTSRGLYSGFVGVAWAIEHLGTAGGSDPLAGVDDTIVRMLEQGSPWKGRHDLIEGLVGLGMYGLERRDRPRGPTITALVVERLEEHARPRPVGVTWHTPASQLTAEQAARFPEGWDDLGVAHGSPGVVAFLGACLAAGVAERRAAPLLEEAVAWVLGERLDVPGERFPYGRAPDLDPIPARTAWCYGDPGVAATLLVAARGAERSDWEEIAVEAAADAASRTVEEAEVVDTSLCHGAAGLAHLYARVHATTGVPALAEAARTWYRRALELPDMDSDDDARRTGFLMGRGGIALALLAGLEGREPAWDRLLALSSPVGEVCDG